MGELSSPPNINKRLFAFNLCTLGVQVEVHLKKGVPINVWESGSSPAPEPREGEMPSRSGPFLAQRLLWNMVGLTL